MKLRLTRAGKSSPARRLILAGAIVGIAVAGVATAGVAGATVRNTAGSTASLPVSWKFFSATATHDPAMTEVLGINNKNAVVGFSGNTERTPSRGFVINGAWQVRTNWRTVTVPDAKATRVTDINNAGVIVGSFTNRADVTRGFVKQGDRITAVSFPGTTRRKPVTELLTINDQGIAGGAFLDAAGHSHGFLYNVRTAQFFLLRLPVAATDVAITGINNTNVVVGFARIGAKTVGFVLNKGVLQQLSFGARTDTRALGINSTGAVVGSFKDVKGKTHGFLWTSTGLHQIDSPLAGPRGTVINGLNDAGVLVGFFTTARGATVGFITVASTTKATNFGWNGKVNGVVTPIPAVSSVFPPPLMSGTMAGSTTTGTATPAPTASVPTGGVAATSGAHY